MSQIYNEDIIGALDSINRPQKVGYKENNLLCPLGVHNYKPMRSIYREDNTITITYICSDCGRAKKELIKW